MKKLLLFILCMGLLASVSLAKDAHHKDGKSTVSAQQNEFKARRAQIKTLIKKYKKAPEAQKPAVKAELAAVVGTQVDAQIDYMKARIAAERANLDNWEKKIQEDEKNLAQVKAQRVEDLLSGEAEKKQKAAKKAWRKQMRQLK
jgi:flagellar biosynthesis chaperone FliJ